MRIRGSGTGFDDYGGEKNRSDSFRKKHRLGKKVKGVLLKRVSNDMAWVSIDGDNLLAQLHSAHQEGARLTFIIKQLVPDIILKEVFEHNTATTNALGLTTAFDASRALFESRIRSMHQDTGAAFFLPGSDNFIELLAANKTLYMAFKDAANCAKAISVDLEARNTGRILYQPWLVPEGRRQSTFIRSFSKTERNPLVEAIIEFEHNDLGLVRAEFLYKKPKAVCKIKLQHLGRSKSLLQYLINRIHPDLAAKTDFLGVTKLPQSGHGGILTELMFRRD
ncbi:MAG: hypothetical protein JEY79_05355 [Pseudodesulfovibrio sp.]|nr:hypothetical protein [Pseudodesulfovibrio sp.]